MWRYGTLPHSTWSPSLWSSAGRTLSEPSSAHRTTRIVPAPIVVKIAFPANSIPVIAISTVAPEMSTACPEVAAVRSSDSCGGFPLRRSSRSRCR